MKQTVHRRFNKEVAVTTAMGRVVELTDRIPDNPSSNATTELIGLVEGAIRAGKLSLENTRLILMTRVADRPITTVPGCAGKDPQTLRERRLRAEALLAAAVA